MLSFVVIRGVLVAVAVVGIVVMGSALYWLAEGRPVTPREFRARVAESGLEVDWTTSGPRGGGGSVDTRCGSVDVAITDIDDQFWIRWDGRREPLTPDVVEALLSCAP